MEQQTSLAAHLTCIREKVKLRCQQVVDFVTLLSMTAVTFDTLKFVKALQASGMPVQQAEAVAGAVRDSHDAADLATKSDLRELELRMTVKLGSMMVMAVAVVAALVKLL